MEFPNGSRILFATEEQDDMSFEGFVLDWAWIDEPIRQSVYSGIWSRLNDFNGSIWFTLTPLGAKAAWLNYSMIMDAPKDVFFQIVRQEDNPFMTPEKIKSFAEGGEYTESELKSRRFGEFETAGDRVFECYDPSVHKIKPFAIPKEWIHGITVDPHHKRPAFIVWWAYNPDDSTYYFYREWPVDNFFKKRSGNLSPREYATLIRNAEGTVPSTARVVDPRFGKAEHQRHGIAETSWVDLMAEQGLYFDANVPNVGRIEWGHDRLFKLMWWNKDFPISVTNRPKFFIFDDMENTDRALMSYQYLDTKDPIKGMFQKVSEEFKDPIDCLRYTVLYPIPPTDDEVQKMQRFTEQDLIDENAVL